jgi:hypothetical protein
MNRKLIGLISGTATLAIAALAACSGGGSSSSPTPPSLSSTSNNGATIQAGANGLQMVLTINPKGAKPAKSFVKNVARRSTKATRQPKYISYAAEGLQIAVTATAASGPVTKTVYADITSTSPLCTQNTSDGVLTCTLTVPTLAASESIAATEVDNQPTAEVTTPGAPGAGYGTGFPTASNVLGATTATVSTTPGTTSSISFGIDPVIASVNDCGFAGTVLPAVQTENTASYDNTGGFSRIVVTAGFAQTTIGEQELWDVDECVSFYPSPPAAQASAVPLADVNGSPEPLTYTSSSQHVLVALANPASTSTPAPAAFGASASLVNTSLLAFDNCVNYFLQIDSGFSAPATITENNHLSATTPFTGTASPYAFTKTFNVVPVSVTPTTANVTITGTVTATVTGSDYLAQNGMAAYGAVDQNGNATNQNDCVDGSNTTHATVAMGALNTANWTQPAVITPTVAGACTFVLTDADTNVVSQTISVTVNP